MVGKGKQIDDHGQNIYVGIDVHLKNWSVTVLLEQVFHKTFSMEPNAEVLHNYLARNFPGGNYFSAYEAGFCGFSVHRDLERFGIKNIVVNPADIPTTDKERKQKEDQRDSHKIARTLRSGELVAIYVPSESTLELRGLVRYRKTLVKEISRSKSRVKSFLHFHGIAIPREFDSASRHWSSNFTRWLETVRLTTSFGHTVLSNSLDTVNHLRETLLRVNKELRVIAGCTEYAKQVKQLASIPGVGLIVSMTLLSELESMARFKSLDNLCSYIGLVPTTSSTSDNERVGGITPRSNKPLRGILIESAWIAVRCDPSLAYAYVNLCRRMKPSNAIIRIAKKLLSRIRYVMIKETEYVPAMA